MIVRTFNVSENSEFSIYSELDYNWYENLTLNRKVVLISDENIFRLYPEIFRGKLHIILQPGENSKNFDTVNSIIEKFIEFGVDRNFLIIGFGGGVVCDITGFVSNIYMRGIKFGFIPSTLLSQVDAAIGGKNGINHGKQKNLIGNISQPEFILCDSSLFDTLPEIEYKSGLGEVIKYSLIHNYELFDVISEYYNYLKERDQDLLNKIVRKCIQIKIGIVKKDPRDIGFRHILNFGHSIGHCIEVIDKLPHGLAVVKGMNAALDLSVKFNYTTRHIAEKIKSTLRNLDYDIEYNLTGEHFELLANDKKKNGDSIDFIFLRDIGDVIISKIEIKEIISALS